MPRRRHAFSLIEIMVAVAIIALLAGLLVVGIGHVGNSAKSKSTFAALETAQMMLDDFRANSSHLPQPGLIAPGTFTVGSWLWVPSNPSGSPPTYTIGTLQAVPTGPTPAPTPDFWSAPNFNAAGVLAEPLVAPGNVTVDMANGAFQDRYDSAGVINTEIAMGMLLTVPRNKSLVQSLPSGRTMYLLAAPSGSHVSNFTGSTTGDPIQFPAGLQVAIPSSSGPSSSGGTYAFYHSTAATTTPPTGGSWSANPDPFGIPLLVDAWNNPIILVPASGLLVRTTTTGATPVVVTSPDHLPFFASAGPDGDFSKGDDNLYSFQK